MSLRRAIGHGVLSVALLTLGLESTSAAQPREPSGNEAVGATVSVTGCLLDERTYAAARGLATVSSGSTTGAQLVLVGDSGNGRTPGDVPSRLVYALTGVNEAKLRSKVGTRVELNTQPSSLIHMRCGDVPMFRGQMGRKGNLIAVKIQDRNR